MIKIHTILVSILKINMDLANQVRNLVKVRTEELGSKIRNKKYIFNQNFVFSIYTS